MGTETGLMLSSLIARAAGLFLVLVAMVALDGPTPVWLLAVWGLAAGAFLVEPTARNLSYRQDIRRRLCAIIFNSALAAIMFGHITNEDAGGVVVGILVAAAGSAVEFYRHRDKEGQPE